MCFHDLMKFIDIFDQLNFDVRRNIYFLLNSSIFYIFQFLNNLNIIIVFNKLMQNMFQLFSHIQFILNMLNNIFFQILIFNRIAEKGHADFFKKRNSEKIENEQNENLLKKKRELMMLKKK